MKLSTHSIFFFLMLLTACLPPMQHVKKTDAFKKMEPLQQIKIKDKQLVFNVLSTGCTRTDDFIIESQIVDQQCQLTIYRIKPDRCKRAAMPMTISLDWDKQKHCKKIDALLINPSITIEPETF